MKIFPSISFSQKNEKPKTAKYEARSKSESANNGKLIKLKPLEKNKKTVAVTLLAALMFCVSNLYAEPASPEKVANSENTNGFFDDKTGFFSENSADTVFAPQPTMEASLEVGFFKEHKDRVLEEEPSIFAAEVPAQNKIPEKETDFKKASIEELRKEFGDPNEDAPIKPVDNAPKPFKAIMAALDAGHKEEAFAYARQYARYLKGVTKVTGEVVSLSRLGMEREGMVPAKKGDTNDPNRYLLDQDYMREEDVKGNPAMPKLAAAPNESAAKALVDLAMKEPSSMEAK